MNNHVLKTIEITSPGLAEGGLISGRYTFEGENIHPPFTFRGIPVETASLAIIMQTEDVGKTEIDHWVIWNLAPTAAIAADAANGITGLNNRGENVYLGPYLPYNTACYQFKFFALNTKLSLDKKNDKPALEKAMDGHIIASGVLNTFCREHILS